MAVTLQLELAHRESLHHGSWQTHKSSPPPAPSHIYQNTAMSTQQASSRHLHSKYIKKKTELFCDEK